MDKKLLFNTKIYFFALLVLPLVAAFIPLQSSAQTAGDVAFIGYDGDSDGFAVVLFASYSSSDEIHFNSQEWDGSTFAGSGGDFTWVAPSGGTTAGTVLVFSDVNGTPTVNIGSITDDANMNLIGSGDIIYSYTGAGKDTPDTPFLGAVATDGTLYTQPDSTEGTLTNTGLTEAGDETISLTDNIDVAEFTGDRSGNTPNGYRTELNNIGDNWQEENGSGDQSGLVLPFDDTPFSIVAPPTLAFTSSTVSVDEDETSVDLTVELVEANSTVVDVNVAFLSGSSTAGVPDIDGYLTTQVSFVSGDASGATQTVTVNLTDDSDFEGTETAVFQLQNNSAGSIISPDVLTLTINDDDAPDIVFNEINSDPGDDANGDGSINSDDEFIELVNFEDSDIDISGWTFSDSSSDRYIFPEGAVIGAGSAVVLIAEGSQPTQGNFGAALVFTDNALGLNNSSETLTLKDADGNVVVATTYPNEASGESNNLDPDGTGISYSDHSSITGSGGALSSPGTKADGTTWGNGTYAIGIRGNEGWRMVSSPTQSTTFNDLFAGIWTQGITGSDDPSGGGTQFGWTETSGGSFDAPGSMGETMTPGKGYIVYVFEDDEFSTPGVQGGFPKTINTSNAENTGTVNVAVTSNDVGGAAGIDGNEGFNLLGNPFGTDISVTAVLDALDTATGSNTGPTDEDPPFSMSRNIAVWNPDLDSGNGDWEYLSDGDLLAPFQAFFMRYIADGVDEDIGFIRSDLEANQGTEFFKRENETKYKFKLSLEDGERYDPYKIEFSQKGAVELDEYDAFKLFSLNTDAINLYSIVGNHKLAQNVLPERPEEIIEIPLAFDAPNRNKLTFRWDGIDELPQHWDVTLIDRTLGRELDLFRESAYTFTFQQPVQDKAFGEESTLYKMTPQENGDIRFALRINPGQIENSGLEKLPSTNQLNPNYPNPFNPATNISYSLTQETEVKISVWNIVGQKVATLVDGVVEAGTHTEIWNASDMPSGIYIAQMEVGGNVFIRKMTLIK